MKFSKDTLIKKTFDCKKGNIDIFEFEEFSKENNFPMDGAISIINGSTGFKKNNFHELFFVIKGELKVIEKTEEDIETTYIVKEDEMCIFEKGLNHSIEGSAVKVFIVCNPPFASLEKPFL